MAKELVQAVLILTSANSELDLDQIRAEYRIEDGDLHMYGQVIVSGVDSLDTVTGMWDAAISAINTAEGLS